MRGMMAGVAATVATVVMLCTWGCGGTPPPGEDVTLDQVQAECKTLKVPELQKRAETYRDLIRNRIEEVQKLDQKLAAADPVEVSQEDIDKMQSERVKAEKSRLVLMERYKIYFDALRKLGGKMDDVRIEKPTVNEPTPENIQQPR